jgi:hypothetical protein
MRQTITCEACGPYWRKLAKDPRVAAEGERVTLVAGTAQRDYLCDDCGVPIALGSGCYAVGVIVQGQDPRTGWESHFLDVEDRGGECPVCSDGACETKSWECGT